MVAARGRLLSTEGGRVLDLAAWPPLAGAAICSLAWLIAVCAVTLATPAPAASNNADHQDGRTVYSRQAPDGTLQFSDDPGAFAADGAGDIIVLPPAPPPYQPGWFERTMQRLFAEDAAPPGDPATTGVKDTKDTAAISSGGPGGSLQRLGSFADGDRHAPLPQVPPRFEKNILVLALVAMIASGLLWVLLAALVLAGVAAAVWRLSKLETRIGVQRAWRIATALAPGLVLGLFGPDALVRYRTIFAELLRAAGLAGG